MESRKTCRQGAASPAVGPPATSSLATTALGHRRPAAPPPEKRTQRRLPTLYRSRKDPAAAALPGLCPATSPAAAREGQGGVRSLGGRAGGGACPSDSADGFWYGGVIEISIAKDAHVKDNLFYLTKKRWPSFAAPIEASPVMGKSQPHGCRQHTSCSPHHCQWMD